MQKVCFLALSLVAMTCNAQIFSCKDLATGKTTYTDVACPDKAQSKVIATKPTPTQISLDRQAAYEARWRFHLQEEKRKEVEYQNELAAAENRRLEALQSSSRPKVSNGSWSCRMAEREIEIAQSFGSEYGDDRIRKINGSISNANVVCGTDRPLLMLSDDMGVQTANNSRNQQRNTYSSTQNPYVPSNQPLDAYGTVQSANAPSNQPQYTYGPPQSGFMTRDAFGAIVQSNSNYVTRDAFGAIVQSNSNYVTKDAFGTIVPSRGSGN